MRRSLTLKLILAFLLVSLTAGVLIAVLASLITQARFNEFVYNVERNNLSSRLVAYYETFGSWDGIEAINVVWERGGGGRYGGQQFPPTGGSGNSPAATATLADADGLVLVGAAGYEKGDRLSNGDRKDATPLTSGGELIGYVLLDKESFRQRPLEPEALFLSGVNQALILGTVGAVLVALLLGVLLARNLTRPLRELTTATRDVAAGRLETQVPIRSQDELGILAASFNQMNAELLQARDLRRQMTADIAHDLRTPLSIILGHSEALSEGVLPPSEETFHVIHDEAKRLSRLVDDLRTLSLAEAGELKLNRQPAPPKELLQRAAKAHAQAARRKEISLEISEGQELPQVLVDSDRIAQVLDNLLNNALRYTPASGQVHLSARQVNGRVRLTVHDSGPGIPTEELPRVFNRFYRGDKSRQRHDGGSGLGLAIARSLVEAHNGHISAESEPGQGMTFHIDLPLDSSFQST